MALANEELKDYEWLSKMYADTYYPNFLVDKIKAILLDLCEQIECEQPESEESLLKLTHAATERINDLAEEFSENNSELETVAREFMADEFRVVLSAYGFHEIDIEDAIAPRDW